MVTNVKKKKLDQIPGNGSKTFVVSFVNLVLLYMEGEWVDCRSKSYLSYP